MSLTPESLKSDLSPYVDARRWVVAYSGGVDSLVLLHLLVELKKTHPDFPPLSAIHVNHQLQEQSAQWAEHCQQQAQSLGVSCSIHQADIDQQSKDANIEANARKARYQIFDQEIREGDLLLMAHHLDDQVETLLLRLLRGSGTKGGGAMPQSRPLEEGGQLLRPLLQVSRKEIEAYATANHLSWIEDPSNRDPSFDRNFLRLELLPKLEERWPQYRQTLARAARLNRESAELNRQLAHEDFENLRLDAHSYQLPIEPLQAMDTARLKNLLRYWLSRGLAAGHFQMPSDAQLQTVLDDVIVADQASEPLVQWDGVQIRRFNGHLYAMQPLPEFDSEQAVAWQCSQPITLPGVGELSVHGVVGRGLSLAAIEDMQLTVKFRTGGERCQPSERQHSQTLKKLFQEYAVEPWLRDRTPLFYLGDELVAVGDYFICKGFEAIKGEAGIELLIHRF